jgi:TolB-like protein
MRNTIRILGIIAFVAVIGFTMVACGGTPKATVSDELDTAIRDASDYLNNNIPAGSKLVILNIQSDSAPLSNYIIDELIANTVNDRVFTVVDRAQLDAIRAEQNFQFSGEVDDNLALEVGKFFGAQSIVSGTVSMLGNRYRMTIRALEVQTAQVQGQFNKNINTSETVAALMRSGSGGTSGTATASGGRTQTGTTSGTTAPAAATPAAPPAPARAENGTYTFWPRPRATIAGLPTDWYLDKIIVSGNYMTVYVTGAARGTDINWNVQRWSGGISGSPTRLDVPNSPRSWTPVRYLYDEKTYNGNGFTFENVTGKSFILTSDYDKPPLVLEFNMENAEYEP